MGAGAGSGPASWRVGVVVETPPSFRECESAPGRRTGASLAASTLGAATRPREPSVTAAAAVTVRAPLYERCGGVAQLVLCASPVLVAATTVIGLRDLVCAAGDCLRRYLRLRHAAKIQASLLRDCRRR
jgi:hypothetical protein